MPSSNDTDGSEYEVGYGRPPRHARFKKGQSGNPKGRPKGSLNLGTVLERTLRETVVINENGQRRQITKLEAAMKQLVNKSAAGDLAAIKFLAMLVRYSEEGVPEAESTRDAMTATDEKVMQGLLERLGVEPGKGARSEDSER